MLILSNWNIARPTNYLTGGDFILGTRKYVNDDYFKNWSNEMAWMLGFWAADGCVHLEKGKRARLTWAQKDYDLIYKIHKILKAESQISFRKTKKCHVFIVNSMEMYKDLCSIFNMDVQRKSKTLIFPNVPSQYIKHFVLGYVCGDGSLGIYSNKPRLSICSGSTKFVSGFLETVYDNTGIQGITSKNGTAFNILYQGIKAKCLAYWLYHDATIYLDRKMKKAQEIMKWQQKRIWAESTTPKMYELFPHILDGLKTMRKTHS